LDDSPAACEAWDEARSADDDDRALLFSARRSGDSCESCAAFEFCCWSVPLVDVVPSDDADLAVVAFLDDVVAVDFLDDFWSETGVFAYLLFCSADI